MPPRKPRAKADAPPRIARDELAAAARAVLLATPGLTASALKKALPVPCQKQHAEALAILRDAAVRGEVFRLVKGKTERLFAEDPIGVLDRVVPRLLAREGPMDAAALKQAVEREVRGHGDLSAEWTKSALARRMIFEHAPAKGKKAKRFAHDPDLASMLRKVFVALRAAVAETDAAGVPRERIVDAIGREIGIAAPAAGARSPARAGTDRDVVRAALLKLASEHPAGTLLAVPDVRARAALDKARFDAAALALAREGSAVLHHHDHAAALSERDRQELVADGRGTHYVGIAPRSGP